jgi:hypothetical protein
MKTILMMLLAAMMVTNKNCNKNKTTDCFKGRLEIKGICSNYTIKLLEGNIDTSLLVENWTDEHTGKAYTNVFALGSPCTFPESIKEGDEFYFKIDTVQQDCNVCMAYYPTPQKKLAIKVVPACK